MVQAKPRKGRHKIADPTKTQDPVKLKRAATYYLNQAARDIGTGLFNRRRYLEEAKNLEKSAHKGRLDNEIIHTIVLDVDNFRAFNDAEGHEGGNEALRHLANILSQTLRENDFVGRYAGDEFVIVMHGSDINIIGVAERLIDAINKRPMRNGKHVTASIGIASYTGQELRQNSMQRLFELADIGTFHSKERGRNCISIATNPEGTKFCIFSPVDVPNKPQNQGQYVFDI